MTLELGDSVIHINGFRGQTWITVSRQGSGITVALDEREAMQVAGEIIASVRKLRKR